MFLLSVLLSMSGCADKSYQGYNVGENFGHNIDGHFKKLPKDYCMEVLLGSTTKVFKIPDEKIDIPFFSNSVYLENATLEGHYILGWFNDTHLVLCEEKNDSVCEYFSLEFGSNSIIYYDNEESVYDKFGFNKKDWFFLCNTNLNEEWSFWIMWEY